MPSPKKNQLPQIHSKQDKNNTCKVGYKIVPTKFPQIVDQKEFAFKM